MESKSEIKVIKNYCKEEYKEKGSRFIALAFSVNEEDEILTILERTRKEYYDATHHCYAYKINNKIKYSDAGEPSGTAGIRILNAIDHYELSQILVIVVRYFGGTKLGVGGLGKAYFNSAYEVLSKAEIITKKLYQKIFINVEFHFTQKLYHLMKESESKILNVNYTDKVNFECLIDPKEVSNIISHLNDLTNGSVEISEGEKLYSIL